MNLGTIKKVRVYKGKTQIMIHLDLNTIINDKCYNIFLINNNCLAFCVKENHFFDIDGICDNNYLAMCSNKKIEFEFCFNDIKSREKSKNCILEKKLKDFIGNLNTHINLKISSITIINE